MSDTTTRGIIGPMSDETSGDSTPQWYYCLKHATVEEGVGCRALDRLGPYPSREAAAHALETAARRTREQDRKDAAWEGDD